MHKELPRILDVNSLTYETHQFINILQSLDFLTGVQSIDIQFLLKMNSNQASPTDQRRHWHGTPGNRHEHQNVWVIGRPPQNYASTTSVDYGLSRSLSATSPTTSDVDITPTAAIANANMTTRPRQVPPPVQPVWI